MDFKEAEAHVIVSLGISHTCVNTVYASALREGFNDEDALLDEAVDCGQCESRRDTVGFYLDRDGSLCPGFEFFFFLMEILGET